MIFEERFIFLPVKYPQGNWSPSEFEFEDVFFESSDGTKLHGWYIPHPNPCAKVLFCNGRTGNLTWQIAFLKRLLDDVGITLFTFDYRGYGRSEGTLSERGIYKDVRAARDWLANREKVSPNEIVIHGGSLGGAPAVDLAAKEGAKALVLLSTFTSVVDVTAKRFPYLPMRWLMRCWLMRCRLDSLSKISAYQGPLFAAHGTADDVIPLELGEKLFAVANQPKQFLKIPDWGHDTPPPDLYFEELRKFLLQLS